MPADLRAKLLRDGEGLPADLLGAGLSNLEYAPVSSQPSETKTNKELIN